MHFYGKSIRIKDLYFIEFFKIAVPKLGPDIIFESHLAQVMFFYVKFIFFIPIRNLLQILCSLYTVRI